MSEMIERAGKAVLSVYADRSPRTAEQAAQWIAVAVIDAMRTPSAAMLAEAMNIDGQISRGQMTAVEAYRALLDAALEAKA